MARSLRHDPAPHGYDDQGVPLAPHGLNLDGTPRKSGRGRMAGTARAVAGAATKTSTPKTNKAKEDQRKSMLVDLVNSLIVTPLASASKAPQVIKRLGERHADALAGDALILNAYAPPVFDGVILWARQNPKVLSWMDKAEENAPFILIAQGLLGMGKAMIDNHLAPNPAVADAGRNLSAMHIAAMAEAVNAEADRLNKAANFEQMAAA